MKNSLLALICATSLTMTIQAMDNDQERTRREALERSLAAARADIAREAQQLQQANPIIEQIPVAGPSRVVRTRPIGNDPRDIELQQARERQQQQHDEALRRAQQAIRSAAAQSSQPQVEEGRLEEARLAQIQGEEAARQAQIAQEAEEAEATAMAEAFQEQMLLREKARRGKANTSPREIIKGMRKESEICLKEPLANLEVLVVVLANSPDADVHELDEAAVMHAENLIGISEWFDLMENPGFTLAQVGAHMLVFAESNPDFFNDYWFNGARGNVLVTPPKMANCIRRHFNTMDAEAADCPAAREIWSRAWSLALHLHLTEGDWNGIRILYDAVIENYAMQGKCFQGRFNRGIIAYARLLTELGIGQPL